uniref:Uncharacterized protein n=1 Tax=Aegilops tauschii TaxID=37682 RepID=M8C8H3_AEGTA
MDGLNGADACFSGGGPCDGQTGRHSQPTSFRSMSLRPLLNFRICGTRDSRQIELGAGAGGGLRKELKQRQIRAA